MNAEKFQKLLVSLSACSTASEWAAGKSLAEAWETCPRADWLLWLCGRMEGKKGWPNRKAIVLAACAVAETALKFVEKRETRPLLAIQTARKWAIGQATIAEVRNAARIATNAATNAAYAAANAAYAATNAATNANAAVAAGTKKKHADIVRRHLTIPVSQ